MHVVADRPKVREGSDPQDVYKRQEEMHLDREEVLGDECDHEDRHLSLIHI